VTVDLVEESTHRRRAAYRIQREQFRIAFPQNARYLLQVVDDHEGCPCQGSDPSWLQSKAVSSWSPETTADRAAQLYDDEEWVR
jgi:hypothetical protein